MLSTRQPLIQAIVLFAGAAVTPLWAQTFTKDVAPIFQKHCQSCHHEGTVAPMSLMTYKDARPWARAIKERVLMRDMPPWHLDKTVGIRRYKNDISLTDREIDTIAKWVDAGSPRSEEHTSELQSQSNLVCRLLLEKKKKITEAEDTLLISMHRHACDQYANVQSTNSRGWSTGIAVTHMS